jgi:hypothetical protein
MLSKNLELTPLTGETLEQMRAVTGDPIDALRLAADVYAMNAYGAERAVAVEAGRPLPKPPEPISTYIRSFTSDLKARLDEMARMFTTEELGRLRTLGSAIEKRLDDEREDPIESFVLLLTMDPADAVLWIRAHLDDIEARFAS